MAKPKAVVGGLCVLCVVLWGCVPQSQRELKTAEKTITLAGTVVPFAEARVTSAIAGVVARVMIEPGQQVAVGAILLELEPTSAIAEVDRAEASLLLARTNLQPTHTGGNKAEFAAAEAEVVQMEEEASRLQALQNRPRQPHDRGQDERIFANAHLKLRRMADLFARGLVSRSDLAGAENEYTEAWHRFDSLNTESAGSLGTQDGEVRVIAATLHAARARLASLQGDTRQAGTETSTAQVRQADADVARARSTLTQTILTAPTTGTVTTVAVQVGDTLHAGHTVAEIVDISRVKVKGDLNPGLLPFVFVGQAARVTINTVPPTVLTASVEQVQRSADPTAQAFTVTFTLPNPAYTFQPGFTAQVELPVKPEALP